MQIRENVNSRKKLGVKMEQEEMFEDYQKAYEKIIKKQDEYNMQNERMCKHSRLK